MSTIGRWPINGDVPPPWCTTSACAGTDRQPRVLGNDPRRRVDPARTARRRRESVRRARVGRGERPLHVEPGVISPSVRRPASWRVRYSSEPPTRPGSEPEQVDGDSTSSPRRPPGRRGDRRRDRARPTESSPPAPSHAAIQRSRSRIASASPSAIESTSCGIDEHRGAAGDLLGRRAAAGHDRGALRHRLGDRQPESLLQARVGEHLGEGVQRRQVGMVDEAEEPHVAGDRVELTPARLRRPPRAAGASSAADAPPRPAGRGSCGARPCRRRARIDRAGRAGHALWRVGGGDLAPGRPPTARPGSVRREAERDEVRPVASLGQSSRSASRQRSSPARITRTPWAREPFGRVDERDVVHRHDVRRRVAAGSRSSSGTRRSVRWRARRGAGPSRFHDSYNQGRASGRCRTAIGGTNEASGARRWRPATPTSSTSGCTASRASHLERRDCRARRARRARHCSRV